MCFGKLKFFILQKKNVVFPPGCTQWENGLCSIILMHLYICTDFHTPHSKHLWEIIRKFINRERIFFPYISMYLYTSIIATVMDIKVYVQLLVSRGRKILKKQHPNGRLEKEKPYPNSVLIQSFEVQCVIYMCIIYR